MMAQVDKNAELAAAIVASHQFEFDDLVDKVEARAKSYAPHRTGHFASSIQTDVELTPRGVLDRVVYSDDPQAGIIEFGHLAKNGTWVPGHYTFANTLRSF